MTESILRTEGETSCYAGESDYAHANAMALPTQRSLNLIPRRVKKNPGDASNNAVSQGFNEAADDGEIEGAQSSRNNDGAVRPARFDETAADSEIRVSSRPRAGGNSNPHAY